MEALRIVFMGTPDFAVGILDMLVKKEYNIVGVITAPDRPAGRGRKLNESAVKKYAVENELTVLQPTKVLLASKRLIRAKRGDSRVYWLLCFSVLTFCTTATCARALFAIICP